MSSAADVPVCVQDFGIGIPDDEQDKIFEPFYRVDKSRVKKPAATVWA